MITLRSKPISGNRRSLFLDFFPAILNTETGKLTRRCFLGLYLVNNPKTAMDKQENRAILELAEIKRAERQIEIANGVYGGKNLKSGIGSPDLIRYMTTIAGTKQQSQAEIWNAAIKRVTEYFGKVLPFQGVTVQKVNDFKKWLTGNAGVSRNTASAYFSKFMSGIKLAESEGLLPKIVSGGVCGISGDESVKAYLTLSELQRLANQPCSNEVLKRASLFSALTGLRFSDISALTWDNVKVEHGEYKLSFRVKKTSRMQELPISLQAYSLLGSKVDGIDHCFEGLNYSSHLNQTLKQWVKDAGIDKVITFHGFRRSHACLLLAAGTSIVTIAELLGQKDTKTAMIYARAGDTAKRTATESIQISLIKIA